MPETVPQLTIRIEDFYCVRGVFAFMIVVPAKQEVAVDREIFS